MDIQWRSPLSQEALQQDDERFVSASGESFPIVRQIPRFVESEHYVENFGSQWRRFRVTQLDSHTQSPITASRLQRCLGTDLWTQLAGKKILECGCGAGRFTEILLQKEARVVSVDMSTAVDVNATLFAVDDRHQVVQADILNMPFAPQQFDVVLCLGVIQHTPNPENTIAQLAKFVRPGGWLVIDHYTFTRSYLSLRLLYRQVLKRLPRPIAMASIETLAAWLLPLHKRWRHNRLLSLLLNRISPLITYYQAFPELDDNLQRDWALLDTHDSLTDHYKHFRNCSQIFKTLQSLGLTEINVNYGGNGVEARARRPL